MALDAASEAWSACAPLIAGVAKIRIGVRKANGRIEYRSRDERPLISARPVQPAAVRVYGPDGCCSTLCLDLDVSRGGLDAVNADKARLVEWLHRRGARIVADRSPTGGRHIYVPLAGRVPYITARETVEALAVMFPTIDAGPHRSLKTGCIRPPGATHKSGGFQELTMSLAASYEFLRRRNKPEILAEIRSHLGAEIAAVRGAQTPQEPLAPVVDGGGRPLSDRLRVIAEKGVFSERYQSPSEARQAVITGAVAAGWTLADVAIRLHDGRWPGLSGMYARYSPAQQHVSLGNDWHKAQQFISADREKRGLTSRNTHVRKSHTSLRGHRGGPIGGVSSQGLAEHQLIRTWRAALRVTELARFPGRKGHLERMVLRALGEAAHKTGSRYVAFGDRALAVATGAHYSSVAAVLRGLAGDPDGWITLVEHARGELADLYELTIPRSLEETAPGLRFDKGKAHALRPAFRALGHVAAFTFEAIETGRASTVTTLVSATGMCRSAVSEAVDVLVAHGLVDRDPGVLVAHPERLLAVAELLGVLDLVTCQLRRYAVERAAWRRYLSRNDPYAGEPVEDYWWPPGDLHNDLLVGDLMQLVAS